MHTTKIINKISLTISVSNIDFILINAIILNFLIKNQSKLKIARTDTTKFKLIYQVYLPQLT